MSDLCAFRLRAELTPLHGKYYGSVIQLYDRDTGDELQAFDIWVMGDYTPSERELEAWDDDEYGPYEVCDSHFESALGYAICKQIVDAINA